jgi:uncharacterized protein
MRPPDFEGAKRYALGRLQNDLPSHLLYHSLSHTRDIAVPAAARMADSLGITGEERLLLLTAAHYHDLGYIEQIDDHEHISARIAGEVLPQFGYQPAQVSIIQGIILATRLPQTPHTLLEEVMADADLDVLGNEDFLQHNRALRLELAATGVEFSDEGWYHAQLDFLRAHRYFTSVARQAKEAQKQRNIQTLVKLQQQSQASLLQKNTPPDEDPEIGSI